MHRQHNPHRHRLAHRPWSIFPPTASMAAPLCRPQATRHAGQGPRRPWAAWCIPLALLSAGCGSDDADPAAANPSTSATDAAADTTPELTTSAPAATTTEPSSAASSDRPGPMALCAAPEAPHVIAFDRASGDVRWVACGEEPGFRYLEQVSDGIVYVLHTGAFDAVGGHLITDAPPPPPRIGPTGQPGQPQTTVVDGFTISGGQDDPTRASDANGRVLWSQPGHWVYDDVAAIDDGAVFALEFLDSSGSQLVAYEIDTGELRWSTPGDSDPVPWELSPWAADDGQLFAGWTNVHVRNTTDGTPIWSTDWPTIVAGAPSRSTSPASPSTMTPSTWES